MYCKKHFLGGINKNYSKFIRPTVSHWILFTLPQRRRSSPLKTCPTVLQSMRSRRSRLAVVVLAISVETPSSAWATAKQRPVIYVVFGLFFVFFFVFFFLQRKITDCEFYLLCLFRWDSSHGLGSCDGSSFKQPLVDQTRLGPGHQTGRRPRISLYSHV